VKNLWWPEVCGRLPSYGWARLPAWLNANFWLKCTAAYQGFGAIRLMGMPASHFVDFPFSPKVNKLKFPKR